MTARPESASVRAFLARASRRLDVMSAAEGAAVGLGVAALTFILGWPARTTTGLAVGAVFGLLGLATGVAIARARRGRVALVVERQAPQCRNIVVTADELAHHRVSDRVAALVHQHASTIVQSLDLSTLFPARRATTALAVATTAWALAIATRTAAPAATQLGVGRSASTAISGVDVTVVPPAYTKRAPQTLRDPARIEALAGSVVRLAVRAQASRVALSTLRTRDTLIANGNQFTDSLVADADGFVAIEPLDANGNAGARRLIGLTVLSDETPRVRITAPARDLYFKDGRNAIDLAIETNDDIALSSLRLRYTKVSGSGERFTFTEGEVPLTVARRDGRTWTARANWKLDSLALGAGDMVVYRAVATDSRPGAPPSESDSFIAEILSPGGIAAAGFALDPEQERYAVSQQMVILKTERLAAQRASMSPETYEAGAHEIATEQRKVRAEFVFMMGGELADAHDEEDMTNINEEAEAEAEDDLLAGRNLNRGREALLRAIRSMSRAAASLTTADLTTALTHERAALVQLERAFARTRILLRALTQRERLDFSRRLTGTLADVTHDARGQSGAEIDERSVALRRALAGIAELAGSRTFASDAAARASTLAESVLRVDPSSKPLQDAAALLTSASSAIVRDRASEARDLLDRAATALAANVGSTLLVAPRNTQPADLQRLGGALGDALRRAPGRAP